jgi:hypothetical protein
MLFVSEVFTIKLIVENEGKRAVAIVSNQKKEEMKKKPSKPVIVTQESYVNTSLSE